MAAFERHAIDIGLVVFPFRADIVLDKAVVPALKHQFVPKMQRRDDGGTGLFDYTVTLQTLARL